MFELDWAQGSLKTCGMGADDMPYIFLDTCVIIDCAYSRNKWSDPTQLDRLLGLCEEDGVKLFAVGGGSPRIGEGS